jgi:hypothetical protein
MGLASKIRNLTCRLLRSHGPAKLKGRLWDSEFTQGRWNCLDSTPGDCVYAYIEKYSNQVIVFR